MLEFVCAGASAVQIGTALFTDPALMVRIVDDLEQLLAAAGTTIAELRGSAHVRDGGGAAAAGACR